MIRPGFALGVTAPVTAPGTAATATTTATSAVAPACSSPSAAVPAPGIAVSAQAAANEAAPVLGLPGLAMASLYHQAAAAAVTAPTSLLPQDMTPVEANIVEHLQQLQKVRAAAAAIQQQQQQQAVQSAQSNGMAAPGPVGPLGVGLPQPNLFDPNILYQYAMLYPNIQFASPLLEHRALAQPTGIDPVLAAKLTNNKPGNGLVYFDQQVLGASAVPGAAVIAESGIKKRRRKQASKGGDNSNSDTDSASGSEKSATVVKEKRKRVKHAPGQGGTRRLKIDFLDLGEPGDDVQFVGKCGSIIPDGLRGRHEMHNQPWEFSIKHTKVEGVTCIQWSVKNLTSNKTVTITESPFQARSRQKSGNTITSYVMRQALEQRVRDLEEMLLQPEVKSNPAQVANLQSLIKELRRKERNEGILFFGLRHEEVQRNRNIPERKNEETPGSSPLTPSTTGTVAVEEDSSAVGAGA